MAQCTAPQIKELPLFLLDAPCSVLDSALCGCASSVFCFLFARNLNNACLPLLLLIMSFTFIQCCGGVVGCHFLYQVLLLPHPHQQHVQQPHFLHLLHHQQLALLHGSSPTHTLKRASHLLHPRRSAAFPASRFTETLHTPRCDNNSGW
jgi:hypothetical protein